MDTQDSVLNIGFYLQASEPRHRPVLNPDVEDLGEAIEEVFVFPTEQAFICWEGNRIPLCYKYDISVIITELIEMLEHVTQKAEGSYCAIWSSDTFRGKWELTWASHMVSVEATWDELSGGLLESLNRSIRNLKLPIHNFISEWRRPLAQVYEALTAAGYIQDQLEDLGRLERLIDCIPSEGLLYRDNTSVS